MSHVTRTRGILVGGTRHGTGWLPDPPDHRDKTLDDPDVGAMVDRTGAMRLTAADAPERVDLRRWCSPIEDQGALGSCTANAGVGMLEYFQRRANGDHLDGSRLFLYKATRDFLGMSGDTGAFLRSAMGAMRLFGVCPEPYWPYDEDAYDDEPPAFCYSFAKEYAALTYYRLDPAGIDAARILENVRTQLAANLPSMFGFTVYASIRDVGDTGEIPVPAPRESVAGGHAVMAVGYDDGKQVTHPTTGESTTGALLIRNSWGTGWGDAGYGWLPYGYITDHLAEDFWVLTDARWVDTGQFDQ
ncbi:cysteine protease [Pseudactinotalea sp. HY160]|uniref:C1 family peptidase n=1 Tax=Pseudactinotalea sp. HY160 TaxID=2654490 RepID=UPI00128B9B51|nr:C1 family peptidase [Pseudactinotalea sp. HY160]MPV48822.1 cysteine protease [Pseudactinotalea sp. HY160]